MISRRTLLGGFATLAASGNSYAQTRASLWVPPEDAPHEATFMQWPVSREVYDDRWFLSDVQNTIAEIANTIVEFEPVILLASSQHHKNIRKRVSSAVELWDIPTEDLWCRDSGPLIAKNSSDNRVVSHIKFNGWGGKQTYELDGRVAENVADALGFDIVDSGLSGEAGGVEHDGFGNLLAHESSWVNDNRNPGLSRREIEARLLAAYGAEQMIWSPGVYGEDITDYHIDSLARFTAKSTVLVNLPKNADPYDPFHTAALETVAAVKSSGLTVDIIPEPERRRVNSEDFVASYANYYVCNGAVICAQFGDSDTDRIARAALQRHYPDREIVALNVDALGEIGGGIHCATQQLPA